MSFGHLLQYVTEHTWCDPRQDNQYVFKAAKISPFLGIFNHIDIVGRRVALPEKGKKYHVFQIGTVMPSMLSLLGTGPSWAENNWRNFSDSMAAQKMVADIFTPNGEVLPRFNSYYCVTKERVLVLCVEDDQKLGFNYTTTLLYLRVYANNFYKAGVVDEDSVVFATGYKNITSNQRTEIQNTYVEYLAKDGKCLCYINGYRVPNLYIVNINVNDTVELVYDGSVMDFRSYPIAQLRSFLSTKDGVQKYLIHDPSKTVDGIEYVDDIDFYVKCNYSYMKSGVLHAGTKSYLLSMGSSKNKRQVTHRDYSVSVDGVAAIGNNLKIDIESEHGSAIAAPILVANMSIDMVVRKTAPERVLAKDASRIFELYKLPQDAVIEAMAGNMSTLPMWTAAALENSDYIKHMATPYEQLSTELLSGAFGYNGISVAVGYTPTEAVDDGSSKTVLLPYQLRENSTVYEYDSDGLYIGNYPHIFGDSHTVSTENRLITQMAEVISGRGTSRPNLKFGTDIIPVTPGCSYRVYRCSIEGGEPNDVWLDITGTNKYEVVDDVLLWLDTADTIRYLAVSCDDTFMQMDIQLQMTGGVLEFDLVQEEDRGAGYVPKVMTIPGGQLDIIMNNYSMIKGIDYFVNFPKIRIVNKNYLKQPCSAELQDIHVRMVGFCSPTMQLDHDEDVGFIQFGTLSNNQKFDIRDDKVLRITVDGKLTTRDQLMFSEETPDIFIASALNGLPYQVKDIIVPMNAYTGNIDTYALRAQSMAVDQQVSDYMTMYTDQPVHDINMIVTGVYTLVSPYFSVILDDMVNGTMTESQCALLTQDTDIMNFFLTYDFLLQMDPLNSTVAGMNKFVKIVVHPHEYTLAVNINQYRVLQRLAFIKSGTRIDISTHVTLLT